MNFQTVSDIAKKKLERIEPLSNLDILRAEYIARQHRIAVYFIDYGRTEIPDDLRVYQEGFLASDYYYNPGYLQWNYYLIFLREDYTGEEKRRVEADDSYSRKFLFNTSELRVFFDEKTSVPGISRDIVLDWKRRLDEVTLNEVYSDTEYTKAVSRFLRDEVISSNEPVLSPDSHQDVKIEFLRSLTLKPQYRPYPETRTFSFGKVNLLTGVNGVGKTSLLEAIENIACGNTLRNLKSLDKPQSIEATYNSEEIRDVFTPNSLEKYRRRDRYWYNNDYKSRNHVCWSFNRYNFYNSDAAFNINNADDDRVVKYLTRIAIGAEFGRIRDRIAGFRDRLLPHLNSSNDALINCQERIRETNKIIRESTSRVELKEYIKNLSESCEKASWKKHIPQSIGALPRFEKLLNEASSIIEILLEIDSDSEARTKNDCVQESKLIKQISNEIQHQIAQKTALQKEENQVKSSIGEVEKKLKLLDQIIRYFQHPDSFMLDGLSQSITELDNRLRASRTISEAYKGLDLTVQVDLTEEIGQALKRLSKEIGENTKLVNGLKTRLQELRRNLNSLQNLRLEIKARGKDYLLIQRDTRYCPLCETSFPDYESLLERVNTIVKSIDRSTQIGEFEREISEAQRNNAVLEKQRNLLTQLMAIASQFYKDQNYQKFQLRKITNDFETIVVGIGSLEVQRDILLSSKSNLERFGLYEGRFMELKASLTKMLPNLGLKQGNQEAFDASIKQLESQAESLRNRLSAIREGVAETKSNIETISVEHFGYYQDDQDTRQKLVQRKKRNEQALSRFEDLGEYFDFNGKDAVSDIDLKIKNLRAAIVNIQESNGRLKQREVFEAGKRKLENEEAELVSLIERIKPAIGVLDEILTKDTEEKVLMEFIEANSVVIEEIFAAIHVPHEFAKVRIEADDIFLLRKESNHKSTISTISSGQRSALALSLFLTLNRQLKNGPSILLFDDPVVYADDLNMLSFLDYLRDLVLSESRQIFFATANRKLAGLFEKKFSFLGEDFRRVEMTRK